MAKPKKPETAIEATPTVRVRTAKVPAKIATKAHGDPVPATKATKATKATAPATIPPAAPIQAVVDENEPDSYSMRISRLTIDKLGVKLYDKASAVVAELVANSYDADAERVDVFVPLGIQLANKAAKGKPKDKGLEIRVTDDGHGMTPLEAQRYFLVVGADRRDRRDAKGKRLDEGSRSRDKKRWVMGRKGIGKLAPFGICRTIEIISSGGPLTTKGYRTSHFILDFDKIVVDRDADEEARVGLDSGEHDKTWRPKHGTEVRLTNFLPKRVPTSDVFVRQIARRFALSAVDFETIVHDTNAGVAVTIPKFEIALNEATKLDVGNRPVPFGTVKLPVTGWLAHAKESYRDEEEAGVRIYARGKIVATTRDFEQKPGFTGEFTTRSYLVGEVHAEWLDEDNDEDLVRTDRQGILWDSDKGSALREWGATLIKEIGNKSKAPRRTKNAKKFVDLAELEKRARERYADESVVEAAVALGNQIGAFASEEDLQDADYINGLADVILSVAPHQALITAFREISGQSDKSIDELVDLFGKTRVAEMASYAQIADERVRSIDELREVIDDADVEEKDLQKLIARAPWLIQPDWSVISENQGLKVFRNRFAVFLKETYGIDAEIAISYEKKRPDFTLIHVGRALRVVELKKPGHAFGDDDYLRLENYLEAFQQFFAQHTTVVQPFADGWQVDLIADKVGITDQTRRRAYHAQLGVAWGEGRIVRSTWFDFLAHATTSHEMFLEAHDRNQPDDDDED